MKEEKSKKQDRVEDKPIKKEDYKSRAEDYLNGWKRCLADFDNYKKQQVKFLEELKQYATEGLIREIVPILDSFELALKTIPDEEKTKEWKQGVFYIKSQLEDVLASRGMEKIKSMGEKFNPELHEAVESIESDKESGTILQELQKGYTLHGKVIRPARVKVVK